MVKRGIIMNCNLCERKCNVDRNSGKIGYCKANNNVKIALVSSHYFEEPCISGTKGSRNDLFF